MLQNNTGGRQAANVGEGGGGVGTHGEDGGGGGEQPGVFSENAHVKSARYVTCL